MQINIRNKSIWLFLAGQWLSRLGTGFTHYALSLKVLEITSSASMFAFVLSLKFIPQVLLYPFAGVIVDLVDKKKLVMILDSIRGLLVLVTSILLFSQLLKTTWIIIGFIVASAFIEVLYNPAKISLIQLVCNEGEFTTVNTIYSWINASSSIIAPLLGSLLFIRFGIEWILIIDFVTYAVIVLMLYFVKTVRKVEAVKSNAMDAFREGLMYVVGHKGLVYAISAIGLSRFVVNAFYSIGLPIIIIKYLQHSELHLGYVNAMLMTGTLLSPLLVVILGRRKDNLSALLIARALKFMPFFILALVMWSGQIVYLRNNSIYAVLLIGGVCLFSAMFNSGGFIFLNSYFQGEVPTQLYGRFVSLRFMIYSISEPLGMNFFGKLYELNNLNLVFVPLLIGLVLETFMIYKAKSYHKKQDFKFAQIVTNQT